MWGLMGFDVVRYGISIWALWLVVWLTGGWWWANLARCYRCGSCVGAYQEWAGWLMAYGGLCG